MQRLTSAALVLSLAVATLPAQILDATAAVAASPNGPMTTITVTAQGPAFGFCQVLACAAILDGVPVPPYGTLYLDPATGLVNLFAMPLGPTGIATRAVTIPSLQFDGLALGLQGVFIAPTLQVALGNLATVGNLVGVPAGIVAMDYQESLADNFRLRVTLCGFPPGSSVQVFHEQTSLGQVVPFTPNPETTTGDYWIRNFTSGGRIRRGDVIRARVNGRDYRFRY